jgi:CRP-like cAMP-binding protein/glyoxylase-like metal-dependent hydrolase (beta-lactamase superfamily II)
MQTESNERERTTVAEPIRVLEVMRGALVVEAGCEQVAVGFPEEVVKAWLRAKVTPTAWVVPDARQVDGVVQWALEFPLYHALFVRNLFARGQKIPVLVRERDWPAVVEYLRLTLLGLERAELLAAGLGAAEADGLLAERDALALKRPDGALACIEDFLEPRFFDAEGAACVGCLRVQACGENTYSFFTADDRVEQVVLDSGGAEPPYARPLVPATAPVTPQPFEVLALGASTGFDTQAPCTSLLVQAHGRLVLIDAGPYVRSLLAHAGTSPDQLSAVIVTHAHEDHAVGLTALLGAPRRLKLFATPEVLEILRRKLALLNPELSAPERVLEDAFEPCPVKPGEALDFFGLGLRFHRTLHSIPCAGVELRLDSGGLERRVLVQGDCLGRARAEELARAGVLGPARLAELEALWGWQGDLVFADTGGGPLHGAPDDFPSLPGREVVCVHAASLPEAARHRSTLAAPGDRFGLIREHERPSPLERGYAERALQAAFGVAGTPWLGALLDAARPVDVNRGQVVVRQGEGGVDVFVALGGALGVWVEAAGAARRVAGVAAGEVFGEMAPLLGAPRSASVQAEAPARLLRLRGDLFRRFAEEAGLLASLPDLWRKRQSLEAAGPLGAASVSVKNALARAAIERSISAGATLIREGSRSDTVFVLVRGRAQVYRGDTPLIAGGAPVIVPPGSLLGEAAPFLKAVRNASIVTLDECEVLAIRGKDFERIVRACPQLYCHISRLVRARQAA